MADLVRKYKLHIIDHSVRHDKDTGHHHVDAIAQPDEIQLLEANGYHVERHEDVDEVGKARQAEVGKGNHSLSCCLCHRVSLKAAFPPPALVAGLLLAVPAGPALRTGPMAGGTINR